MHQGHIAIAVQGASHGALNTPEVLETAKQIGQDIAAREAVLLIGNPSGFPLWAALGAATTSLVLAFSPARNRDEHTRVFRLPNDHPGFMIYTGLGKAGRNQIMTRTADAIIFGPGGIDTLQEFTIALEEEKFVGVLEGPWASDESFREILSAHPTYIEQVIFDSDPHRLLDQVTSRVRHTLES